MRSAFNHSFRNHLGKRFKDYKICFNQSTCNAKGVCSIISSNFKHMETIKD